MSLKIGRNDPCWCGSGKKYKNCHLEFDSHLNLLKMGGHQVPSHHMIKTPEQVEKIKESAAINIAVLDYVAEHIRAGITRISTAGFTRKRQNAVRSRLR